MQVCRGRLVLGIEGEEVKGSEEFKDLDEAKEYYQNNPKAQADAAAVEDQIPKILYSAS